MKSKFQATLFISLSICVSCFTTTSTVSSPSAFVYKRIKTRPTIQNTFFLNTSKNESPENYTLSDEKVASSLFLLLVSQFLLFIGVGCVIPSIPLYGKQLGFSAATNGIVISAPAVALLLGAKFAGNFADEKRKPAMIFGMAVIAISDLGTALANDLPSLVVARLGLGAGRCVSEAGERGLLADLANKIPELRGRALALQQATVALGIAIGAPLGGVVIERYGPRSTFLVVSGAAIVALVLYLFLPETKEPTTTETKNSSSPSELKDSGDWANLLSKSQWQGLALAQGGAAFGFAAKIASIPVLAAATLPGGAIGSGALLSAAGFSGLIGAPIGGVLCDRISAKETIVLSGTVAATALALVPASLTYSDFDDNFSVVIGETSLSGNALAFSAVVVLWSTAAAAQGPALTALGQQLAPPGREATALALPRAAGDGVYIIAPALLGFITDSVDIPGIECTAAGILTLAGVLALLIAFTDDE